jgi:hypothetical protein
MRSKYHLRVQFETLQPNVQGKTSISLTCETNLTEASDEELQCDHPPPAQSCHDESCNPICQPSTNSSLNKCYATLCKKQINMQDTESSHKEGESNMQ